MKPAGHQQVAGPMLQESTPTSSRSSKQMRRPPSRAATLTSEGGRPALQESFSFQSTEGGGEDVFKRKYEKLKQLYWHKEKHMANLQSELTEEKEKASTLERKWRETESFRQTDQLKVRESSSKVRQLFFQLQERDQALHRHLRRLNASLVGTADGSKAPSRLGTANSAILRSHTSSGFEMNLGEEENFRQRISIVRNLDSNLGKLKEQCEKQRDVSEIIRQRWLKEEEKWASCTEEERSDEKLFHVHAQKIAALQAELNRRKRTLHELDGKRLQLEGQIARQKAVLRQQIAEFFGPQIEENEGVQELFGLLDEKSPIMDPDKAAEVATRHAAVLAAADARGMADFFGAHPEHANSLARSPQAPELLEGMVLDGVSIFIEKLNSANNESQGLVRMVADWIEFNSCILRIELEDWTLKVDEWDDFLSAAGRGGLIRELLLTRSHMTAATAAAISSGMKTCQIRQLDLSYDSLGADGCAALLLPDAGKGGKDSRADDVEVDWLTAEQTPRSGTSKDSQSKLGEGLTLVVSKAPLAWDNVVELSLPVNALKDQGAEAVATAIRHGYLPSLQMLDLRWNSISVEGAVALATAFQNLASAAALPPDLELESPPRPIIQRLQLAGNRIRASGAASFVSALALSHVPLFSVLDLSMNHIGNEILNPLSQWLQLREVAVIDVTSLLLDWNEIDDTGSVTRLAAIMANFKVEETSEGADSPTPRTRPVVSLTNNDLWSISSSTAESTRGRMAI